MDRKIIEEIKNLTEQIKDDNHLDGRIIRDDVFNILQGIPDCIVLYFPMQSEASEDGCDGCHVVRTVKGEERQLIFINSANTRERQAFSVAHELGHIWNVDERLRKKLPDNEIEVEEVINRFAAELLMPEEDFVEQLNIFLNEEFREEKKRVIKIVDFLKIIVRLMDYFFAPFKAVVIRLFEVGIISENTQNKLLEYKESDYVKGIIKEGQYARLGLQTNKKSIPNLADKLEEIERRGLFSHNRIRTIKEKFEIEEKKDSEEMEETVTLQDQKESSAE